MERERPSSSEPGREMHAQASLNEREVIVDPTACRRIRDQRIPPSPTTLHPPTPTAAKKTPHHTEAGRSPCAAKSRSMRARRASSASELTSPKTRSICSSVLPRVSGTKTKTHTKPSRQKTAKKT
ncbi:hypothetical protein Tdes44962_MAKER04663 [Teratosphaeria destructans]|uniref:Uncharacterized protein n=1 Tax=Teratosphaeria destructans TaxID=418781 RepID=A0A9W7SLS4_9PEZI|nr:hypothetical protein Tdes44962_MAKER04663 [Teratosphaeria destructans]